jgi:hypothetical protein
MDADLAYEGRGAVLLEARAGDVALFVSDAWHRGTPALPGGSGRLFLQAHYARRDIAQRLRTTRDANQLSPDAIARAATPRARRLIGLHAPFFYDG